MSPFGSFWDKLASRQMTRKNILETIAHITSIRPPWNWILRYYSVCGRLDFCQCANTESLALHSAGKAMDFKILGNLRFTYWVATAPPPWLTKTNLQKTFVGKFLLFEMLLPLKLWHPTSSNLIFSLRHLSPTSTSRRVSTAIWTELGSAKVTTPILVLI